MFNMVIDISNEGPVPAESIGHTRLRELVGDPSYYNRFCFKNLLQLVLDGVLRDYFLTLSFVKSVTKGILYFMKVLAQNANEG